MEKLKEVIEKIKKGSTFSEFSSILKTLERS